LIPEIFAKYATYPVLLGAQVIGTKIKVAVTAA
jgi:hypothetical protein